MRTLRVLAWPGMPAPEALERAGRTIGVTVSADVVASNELLERRMDDEPPYDLVFPSDYLVERLRARGRIVPLDVALLPVDRLMPWAIDTVYDPGCRHSVPFAFGTTGVLHDRRALDVESWHDVFAPGAGVRVGMLDEVREVVGAALIATGHGPNETGDAALAAARELLEAQRPHVARYDSDDFVTPVVEGAVAAHHAWSGPAAAAARQHAALRYVVPREGAMLWITTAAIPSDAPDPLLSQALIAELMNPELAALTTAQHGYATPNAPARALLPDALRSDPALFPPEDVVDRCHVARDLGAEEARLNDVWAVRV